MKASLWCAIAIVLSLSAANGAEIVVPDDAQTIQTAINMAVNGDTVLVRAGKYAECIKFGGKEITVRSEWGAAMTVIDGNRVDSVVSFVDGEGNGAVLTGFTITNGRAPTGG